MDNIGLIIWKIIKKKRIKRKLLTKTRNQNRKPIEDQMIGMFPPRLKIKMLIKRGFIVDSGTVAEEEINQATG